MRIRKSGGCYVRQTKHFFFRLLYNKKRIMLVSFYISNWSGAFKKIESTSNILAKNYIATFLFQLEQIVYKKHIWPRIYFISCFCFHHIIDWIFAWSLWFNKSVPGSSRSPDKWQFAILSFSNCFAPIVLSDLMADWIRTWFSTSVWALLPLINCCQSNRIGFNNLKAQYID